MAKTKDMGKAPLAAGPEPSTSIDEIFASSSKVKLVPAAPTGTDRSARGKRKASTEWGGAQNPVTVEAAVREKRKKKKQQSNIDGSDGAQSLESGPPGRDAMRSQNGEVETVVDPSIPTITSKLPAGEARKRNKKGIAEDEAFRDSRGTSESIACV